MRILPRFDSHRFFYRPSSSQSFRDRVVTEAQFFRPGSNRLRTSFGCQQGSIASPSGINSLLLACSPNAILWRIRTIIVLALETQTFRALAHVFKEVLKAIAPSLAHCDSSSPIVFVRNTFRIVAAAFHLVPSEIEERTGSAMSSDAFANKLRHGTTAAFGLSSSKIHRVDWFNRSAGALTQPLGMRSTFGSEFQYCPVSKGLAFQINESWMHEFSIPLKLI